VGLLKNLRLLRRSTPRNDKVVLFLVIAGLAPRSRFGESRGNLKRRNWTFSMAPLYLITSAIVKVQYILIFSPILINFRNRNLRI
jgi:hypothetical protein